MPFAIIFGFLAAAFALIIELFVFSLFTFSDTTSVTPLPIGGAGFSLSILLTLFLGVFIEEVSKYLFLIRYSVLRLQNQSLSVVGALIIGSIFGLGFSLPEAWFAWDTIGFEVAPIIGIVLIHIVTSLILACAALPAARRISPLIAFFAAFTLHIAYNLVAFFIFPAY